MCMFPLNAEQEIESQKSKTSLLRRTQSSRLSVLSVVAANALQCLQHYY